MVISSSPARSNDQLLVAATRSTMSRGLTRECSEKSMSVMPSPPFAARKWDAPFDRTHATPPSAAVPGGAAVPRNSISLLRGESLGESNITPLIPAAKAQLRVMTTNQSWISDAAESVLHSRGQNSVISDQTEGAGGRFHSATVR